ncbi:MAG TPA: hypothetical protein VJ750_11490 [Rhizomicrobium sp.]|nr:hypothetical protein [Rhizomicrobium sp.]
MPSRPTRRWLKIGFPKTLRLKKTISKTGAHKISATLAPKMSRRRFVSTDDFDSALAKEACLRRIWGRLPTSWTADMKFLRQINGHATQPIFKIRIGGIRTKIDLTMMTLR